MSTDYIIEAVPNKRLVFAALNKESAIVVYERRGYFKSERLACLHIPPRVYAKQVFIR